MLLFLKSLLNWSPGGHPNAFEKRSDEDLRTQVLLASLCIVAAEM
jgi:hypothetical protein